MSYCEGKENYTMNQRQGADQKFQKIRWEMPWSAPPLLIRVHSYKVIMN